MQNFPRTGVISLHSLHWIIVNDSTAVIAPLCEEVDVREERVCASFCMLGRTTAPGKVSASASGLGRDRGAAPGKASSARSRRTT